MSNLIFNAIVLSALLLFAVSLESWPPAATFSRESPNYTSMLSRYLIAALVAFPGSTFARLREAERALQRVGTKLFSYAGLFTGRPYISEILISAGVSIFLMGSFAARKWIRRFVRTRMKFTASSVRAESSN